MSAASGSWAGRDGPETSEQARRLTLHTARPLRREQLARDRRLRPRRLAGGGGADRGAAAAGKEIERPRRRGFKRVAHGMGEVVGGLAARLDASGKPGEIIALAQPVLGREG